MSRNGQLEVVVTRHAKKRIKQRGLSPLEISAAANKMAGALTSEPLSFNYGGMTIVSKRDTRKIIIISAWQEEKRRVA